MLIALPSTMASTLCTVVRFEMGSAYRTPNVATLECAHCEGVGAFTPIADTHGEARISCAVLPKYDMIDRCTRVTSDGNRKPCEYLPRQCQIASDDVDKSRAYTVPARGWSYIQQRSLFHLIS